MPLRPLKEGATQEEVNEWIIESSQAFATMESQLAEKTAREKQLEEHNQKLFLRITSKVDNKKEITEDEKEIKEYVGEEFYKDLTPKEKEKLEIILKGEDE